MDDILVAKAVGTFSDMVTNQLYFSANDCKFYDPKNQRDIKHIFFIDDVENGRAKILGYASRENAEIAEWSDEMHPDFAKYGQLWKYEWHVKPSQNGTWIEDWRPYNYYLTHEKVTNAQTWIYLDAHADLLNGWDLSAGPDSTWSSEMLEHKDVLQAVHYFPDRSPASRYQAGDPVTLKKGGAAGTVQEVCSESWNYDWYNGKDVLISQNLRVQNNQTEKSILIRNPDGIIM